MFKHNREYQIFGKTWSYSSTAYQIMQIFSVIPSVYFNKLVFSNEGIIHSGV